MARKTRNLKYRIRVPKACKEAAAIIATIPISAACTPDAEKKLLKAQMLARHGSSCMAARTIARKAKYGCVGLKRRALGFGSPKGRKHRKGRRCGRGTGRPC